MKEHLEESVAISVRGLTKRYPEGTLANRGIDLDVYGGEVLAVLGTKEAGKTALVKQITTELSPTSGSIRVMGIDPFREPVKAKKLMGIIPQEATLFSHLTVHHHLYFFGKLKGLSRDEARAEADRWISKLALDEDRWRKIDTLSVGTRQKLLNGQAIMEDTPTIILDETMTSQDPSTSLDVWKHIQHSK